MKIHARNDATATPAKIHPALDGVGPEATGTLPRAVTTTLPPNGPPTTRDLGAEPPALPLLFPLVLTNDVSAELGGAVTP